MNIHSRLREVRVTPLMALCILSLLSAVPLAVAWAADDGTHNQPFPRGLRQFVVAAAGVHFASVGYRLMKAVWRWEPIGPIVWRVLAAYALLAVAGLVGFLFHHYNVEPLAHVVLTLPAGWGFLLLAQAVGPGEGGDAGHPPGVNTSPTLRGRYPANRATRP